MSEGQGQTPAAPATMTTAMSARRRPDVRSLLDAGAHFGHQTRRWNPRMRNFIFGERDGIHILDLDQTVPRLDAALEFLRETVASGGKVLFVATKRQAQDLVKAEAERSGQFYVNNRWLGGMLTNWRTVRKSLEMFKGSLEILGDEEQQKLRSKKELSRITREVEKYKKSLDGIREMQKLPDALFVVDVAKEHIAISEARRLGIPIVAIVDSNCDPDGIDFVVPGNDDAIRALELYFALAADACIDGASVHNERVVQGGGEPRSAEGETTAAGRRVIEIKQPPRRGRGATGTHGGGGGGRGRRAPGGAHSEGGDTEAE
ncbi:MAG: 30S ribosomal protein S2 [Deltaproteobacteria bacterium]|nr:30S ribosomal protein S2 [Deltaproteobacteria bacterium]